MHLVDDIAPSVGQHEVLRFVVKLAVVLPERRHAVVFAKHQRIRA